MAPNVPNSGKVYSFELKSLIMLTTSTEPVCDEAENDRLPLPLQNDAHCLVVNLQRDTQNWLVKKQI